MKRWPMSLTRSSSNYYHIYLSLCAILQVQEKTSYCANAAACACGVAIRAGGDVFIIHRCNGNHFIGYTHLDDERVLSVVKLDDHRYKVGMQLSLSLLILRALFHGGCFIKVSRADLFIVARLIRIEHVEQVFKYYNNTLHMIMIKWHLTSFRDMISLIV